MSVRVSVSDGMGRVVLDHPPLNILTRELLARLRNELNRLEGERDLRVVLLSAEGKHFSAGADVEEHLPPEFKALIPEFLDTVQTIAAFPLPVIAAVCGRCLGGGFELVQAADLIVAGQSATFGQPEILLGVFPPAACAFLTRRLSYGLAAEIVLTGDPISADRAFQAGLVHRVSPDDDTDGAALELAQSMTRHSAKSLRIAKRALRACAPAASEALEVAGRIYTEELMETGDALEGLTAFVEKRTAVWSHQ